MQAFTETMESLRKSLKWSRDGFARNWPIVLMVPVLLLHCYAVSGTRAMWMDEVLTYYPASMPSFDRLMAFITDSINVGHYFYFITIWLWSQFFSTAEISLRLFSSLSLCVAMIFTWLALKRSHGHWPATLSTLVVFSTTPLVLYHNSEARFYGMLMALSAMLLYLTQRARGLCRFEWKTALGLFLLNGLLPLTHPFGFVYSAVFTVVVFIHDMSRRRNRPWYYLSSMAGWLLFVPFVPAFTEQLSLLEPHYWITEPTLFDLVSVYGQGQRHRMFVISVIAVVAMTAYLQPRSDVERARTGHQWDWLLLGLAFGFFSLPALLWFQSQIGKPLFMPRYVIVFELGWAILLSALIARMLPATRAAVSPGRWVFGVLSAMLVFSLGIDAVNLARREMEVPKVELGTVAEGLPIVTDNTQFFLQARYYHQDANDLYFVLDWQSALASPVPNDTQDFKAMNALRRHVSNLGILDSEYILQGYAEFILYRSRHWLNYLSNAKGLGFDRVGPEAVRVWRVAPDQNVNTSQNGVGAGGPLQGAIKSAP